MPQFSNEPPNDPRGHSLQLVRTPVGRPMVAIVTSPDLIGAPTHFWRGRTVPHEQEDCPACLDGFAWRWHAWLSAWNPANKQHFIFECTARISKIFCAYRDANASLRGCKFRAVRRGPAANGRVYLECQATDLEGIKLPQPPDLIKCLSIIWNIRTPDLDVQGILRSVSRVVVDKEGNGELVTGEGQLFEPSDETGPNAATISRLQRDR